MSIIKTFYHSVATCSLLASIGAGSYYFYNNIYKNPQSEQITENYSSLERELESSNRELNNLREQLENQPSLTVQETFMLNALRNYSINDIIWFALNERYECPSSQYSTGLRCSKKEAIAILHVTLNLLKSGNHGKTLYDVITSHNKGVYLFSWIPKVKIPEMRGKIFEDSLRMAFNVLGGNPDYQMTHNFKFYCRHATSPCSWHKSSPNLIDRGRIYVGDAVTITQDDMFMIEEKYLSFHTFYEQKKGA